MSDSVRKVRTLHPHMVPATLWMMLRVFIRLLDRLDRSEAAVEDANEIFRQWVVGDGLASEFDADRGSVLLQHC